MKRIITNNSLSKSNRRKVYLVASDFFLDLAKLVFAGIILTGIMDLEVDKFLLFSVGFVVVSLFAIFGYTFLIRGIKTN